MQIEKLKNELLFIMIFFLLPLFSVFAQPEMQSVSTVDWNEAILQLDITAPIEEEPNQPTGRYKTEQHIIRRTPVITGEVLKGLQIDSSHTLSDMIQKDPVLLRKLEALSDKMKKVFTTATGDRKYLTVRYTLNLFPDLADLVIQHKSPYPIRSNPIYRATEEFSGIVIYAGEPLPLQGGNTRTAELVPCLFPRLYDGSMHLIHSAETTDPQALRSWGNAGYIRDFDLSGSSERIGSYPLRTMARRITGTSHTDLVLSDDAVQMIISSPHNRELLRQGRIIIILPGESSESSGVD